MTFATAWLESGTLFPAIINEPPEGNTGIIVVVPSYDEPSVTELLDSLLLCIPPRCSSEVMVVINAPLNASSESLENNLKTLEGINSWKDKNRNSFFRLFAIDLGQPSIKGWGVGLARKVGMDEAAKRFTSIDNPEGVIASLDADCTVSRNYFTALENELLKIKKRKGCSVYFEHAVSGNSFPENIYYAAYQYELHLRYYFQALKYTGFPNVCHTVGSSMAVKNISYVMAGGMNRRLAGEDFYFIQKVVSAGGYFNLNSTTVYPSPRVSHRVPFGTGAAISKMISQDQSEFMTYNPLSFNDLCMFFAEMDNFYRINVEEIRDISVRLPQSVRLFLEDQDWIHKISEIKANTSGLLTFRKRFFDWFNMFRIVKYLNFSHSYTYEKVPVIKAAESLLKYLNPDNVLAAKVNLLEYYRKLEKES